jgi:hypothetical protein
MDVAHVVLQQIDDVLARGGVQRGQYPQGDEFTSVVIGRRAALSTAWTATIERLSPRGSEYRAQIDNSLERYGSSSHPRHLAGLAGILNALRDDYEAGYMTSIEELVHADVFADFLGMADELLGKNYKDPAAVITGSVLEEHLRKLGDKNAVAVTSGDGTPNKADRVNADLKKASVYNNLEQKQVTAWLDLRNKAAHGAYEEYDRHQVAAMIDGVRAFLLRHPRIAVTP